MAMFSLKSLTATNEMIILHNLIPTLTITFNTNNPFKRRIRARCVQLHILLLILITIIAIHIFRKLSSLQDFTSCNVLAISVANEACTTHLGEFLD